MPSPHRDLVALLAAGVAIVVALSLWSRMAAAAVLVVAVLTAGIATFISWRRQPEHDRRTTGERDALTGLATRDTLTEDVGAFLRDRQASQHMSLYLFDLVGFKKYNDSFGFAAGDALLRHLAQRLVAELGDRGTLYRLRGAQFALTTTARQENAADVEARAARLLSEAGEGFLVECVSGVATLPPQAQTLSEALKLADQGIQSGRGELRRQGLDEGTIIPSSASGGLPGSPYDISELALVVGHTVGLHHDELETVRDAAAWRDVGVIAIPDEILQRRGPLSAEHWRFIKLHTLIGERLLRSNFGLDRVATIVRHSHERWDGGGYPDGLVGHDIPIAARIVFVCSAFQDMTSPRAHRPALTAREAIAELRRHAGSQFDPEVVAAFVGAFSETPGRSSAGVT